MNEESAADWTRLRPVSGWPGLDLPELWAHRELLYRMTRRDLRARYTQSLLGGAWGVLQPLVTMGLFYVVFGLILGLKTERVPYAVFLLSGILLWQLFSGVAGASSACLIANAHIVTKVYFPRLLLPLAASFGSVYDFCISFFILAAMVASSGIAPGWSALAFPLFVLLAVCAGLTVGLWFSAVGVRHRDIQHTLPFLLQVLLYASPIFYSAERIPVSWRPTYFLNPLAGIIQGFRWSLLGDVPPEPTMAWGVLLGAALLVGGVYYFRRAEAVFADVV